MSSHTIPTASQPSVQAGTTVGSGAAGPAGSAGATTRLMLGPGPGRTHADGEGVSQPPDRAPRSYSLLFLLARALRFAVILLATAAVMGMLRGWRYSLRVLECLVFGVVGLAMALIGWTLAEVSEAVRDLARGQAASKKLK